MTALFHTLTTATVLTLLAPILIAPMATQTNILHTMKLATTMSLTPTLMLAGLEMQSITTHLYWHNMGMTLQVGLMFDTYSTLFLPIALLVTTAILQFTGWYMAADPALDRFAKYLLLFLIAMLMLTTANNIMQLFIGWEGVGIMSFLLIGWWHARTNANVSALQAVMYNRIGDIGLIMTMAWFATNYNTWDMQAIFSHSETPLLPLLGLILAATGKSAQFGLHPWLPAAMEGPTPVSALLHSSTMVVAGIFLLIRLNPLMTASPAALALCLYLGALTTLFAALCATAQNDIKKIIAFSTSSQLGLMMLTIGLNQPELAFMHIITHAFFKAMLFLCAGSIIHSLNDEQDIRKMGNTQKTLPITASCLTLGSLALAGTPFLAGFYTKDVIIETIYTSPLNAWALLTATLATILTASYTVRLILYTHLGSPRHTTSAVNESTPSQTGPILVLAAGSITSGLAITMTLLPATPQMQTMAPQTKLLALAVTLLGLVLMADLVKQTMNLAPQPCSNAHTTVTQLMYFNTTHRMLPKTKMSAAQATAMQLDDQLWLPAVGPMMMKTTNTLLASMSSSPHMGTTKAHLMTFATFTITCLAWLNLRHS